ncbi:MarR family winged helix-turn-helix transcriptional regulator [Corynebacterium tapiri]|uniref:MarR family transcriptional regulator n=1 Tax=Corynebacterium tapiri TaxID=1448266 RepID=A0A5C4U5V6_9CORY|nr:MarR family transcriptional regulator [Corynebacterium tapiri]TNL99779.1 MarR family transcriptional regulator [Corynebacterium tapiri]
MNDETRWLSDDQTSAWLTLWAVTEFLPTRLDEQLKRDHGVNLLDYFALAQISMADNRELSMTQLANLCAISPSRLSHVASRLEQRGWVTRRQWEEDRRTNIASLTPAGLEFLQSAAPSHVNRVRELVFDGLTEDDTNELNRILSIVLQRIDPPGLPRVRSTD